MYAPATLMGVAAPSRAFHLDEKGYVMLRQDADRTLLQTVLVRPEYRRQGRARELLHAVEAAFPEKPLVISMLASGPLYSLLEAMQWELMPLPLFEMVRPL
ncbi:GNAT family N-acetyltransferase [Hymenobacter radiodurans]|uniref:GNAT family N-acetyltransferase n=1 Tax=Hymenobacter radiodurans TaxID=2496028 RepID=UPI001058E77C|nr:GNAT family N-acetyltransferase [Hymenobacter radiodurans]